MAAVRHPSVMPLLAAHVLPPGPPWSTHIVHPKLHAFPTTLVTRHQGLGWHMQHR